MAGHSHAANIKHRKSAQDLKKCLHITKLINTVRIFARNGSDIETNVALRKAVEKAQDASVPKEKIENAIKRASGQVDGVALDFVRYNATMGVVSIIIEGSTTNKNRTVNDVRYILNSYGASIVPTGTVEFSFEQMGIINYSKLVASEDDFFLLCIDSECKDVVVTSDSYVVYTERHMLHKVLEKIAIHFGDPLSANIAWVSKNVLDVDNEICEKVARLKDELEEHMDVQDVFINIDL